MRFGHRGVNQPVKNLRTGIVEITSHNHGFAVDRRGGRAPKVRSHWPRLERDKLVP